MEGTTGRYLSSGYVVYAREGVLFGVRFDAAKLAVSGTRGPLVEDLGAAPETGGGQFDFSGAPSGTGTFVYLPRTTVTQAWPVVWLDSFGKMQSLLSVRGVYTDPRFSPDGRWLALMKRSTGVDIFIYDWQRAATTRLTWAGGTISINLGISFSELVQAARPPGA